MSEFKVILTNAGVAAFAQATSISTTVDFSKFAVGDGNGSYYTPTPDLTTLKNERWRGDVLDIKQVSGTSKIEVTTVIPATVGGWYIREMAIFSADGTMLAIGKVPESFKPDPLSGSSKDLSIKAVFEVSNASVVNMVIDPNNVIANKKYVDDKVSDLEQRAGTAIGVVDERVTQHLAQNNFHMVYATRTLSLNGNQTISVPFKVEAVQISGIIEGTENYLDGSWTENAVGSVGSNFDGKFDYFGYFIQLYPTPNPSNFVLGRITNVTNTGFDISWEVIGDISGTFRFKIVAFRHRGDE